MSVIFAKNIILIVFLCFDASCGSEKFDDTIGDVLQDYIDDLINSDGTSQCSKDLTTLMADARDHKLWAMKMLDASGRPVTGILAGNVRAEGSYDECINVRNSNRTIRGKYCVAAILPAEKYKYDWSFLTNVDKFSEFIGAHNNRQNVTDIMKESYLTCAVCVPDSCNSTDLQTIGNFTVEKINSPVQMHFEEKFCTIGEPKPLSEKAILAITIYTILAIIIVISTLYDLLIYQKDVNSGNKFLIVFSASTNFRKIFTLPDAEENLACINGIRAISIAWIILGHTFMFNAFFPSMNGIYIFEWRDNIWNSFVLSGPLAVDTFFCMSGLLIVYGYLTARLVKKKQIPMSLFYIHRILRLTPALAAMVLFYTCLLKYMGDGPYWLTLIPAHEEKCILYWWSTLLYIQNYYNPLAECVNQSWYLAVDTQMYFLSPIILLPFVKYPKQTLIAVFLILTTSAIAAFVVTVVHTVGSIPKDSGTKYFKYIYLPTHIRLTAWMVGAAWGYAIFKTKSKSFILHKKIAIIGWCVALPTMLTMMILFVYLATQEYNKYTAGLFNALVRPTWATGVGWVIFACVHRSGGIVNHFLSLPVFGVLSKLTYSMFLVHFPLMVIIKSQQRQSAYFSNLTGCFEFWAFYAVTVIISVVWTIAFESPLVALEKIILKPKSEVLEVSTRYKFSKNFVPVKITLDTNNVKKSG